jgi:hypothetical protein
VLVGDADQSVRLPAHHQGIAGKQMEQAVVVQRVRHGQDVAQLARPRERVRRVRPGAVRIAEAEQRMREEIGGEHVGVGGVADREVGPLPGRVTGERLLGVGARRHQVADEELTVGKRPMGNDPRHGIGLPQGATGHPRLQG